MSTRWTSFGIIVFASFGGLFLPSIASAADTATPTFTKDIAPIFQEKCQACHRPDSIAPMSLLTYDEARPWARSIKTRVAAAADAAVAHRQDRRHPAVQERPVAHRRADRHDRDVGGRRRAAGHTKDMPPPVQWPTRSAGNSPASSAAPDLVIKSPAWTQSPRSAGRLVASQSSTPG